MEFCIKQAANLHQLFIRCQCCEFMWIFTSSFLILSSLLPSLLKGGAVQLVVSAVSMGTADHLHHFLLQLSHRQTCDRSAQHSSDQHTPISENGRVLILSLSDVVPLFSPVTLNSHPRPCREPTMSGKERSPRHRPWSVYRANTFDLSAEMMGLALSGN